MELDELKPAWGQLQQTIRSDVRAVLRSERGWASVEQGLRTLFNWQVFQIVAGVALAGLGAQFWIPRTDEAPLMVSGLIVHGYGIALIVNGIRVVRRLKQIDYSEPVTRVQKRVVRLERSYVLSGWILGLPWWLLWIPVSLLAMALAGIDVAELNVSGWLPVNIAVGVLGMVLTVLGFEKARRSSNPETRARARRLASGASIDNARRALADIARFEAGESGGERL